MLAWCGRPERGGVDGVGAQYASSPQVPWRGMADPAAYPGCVGQSMNFAEHPYENRGPGHCQSSGGGYPYPSQYRPHPSSPPASYGPPPGQHCGGNYGNGPMPSSPGPYQRQPYPGAVPEMRYGPRHSAPPAYPGSPAPLSKPPGAWDHSMGGGNYGTRPVMMQSPPPIRSPVSSAQTLHSMGNYRTVVPPGPAGPPMGVAPPPPHGSVPVSQSQSPSWSQSPRTTPSPLACHARSPAPPQQPPFSPPTPAPTPQLQKPPSPISGSHDPLQSLEKMVLLDPHNSGGGNVNYGGMQESSGYGSNSGGGTESGPSSPYPTYYNLDQNRMCTPPDPGPPYGIANFAATGAYRTVLPNMDNPALRSERTSSGGIPAPAPPPGVYPQPVVNGVSDGDFGTSSSPMAGPPPRVSEFDRPYAGAGPRGGTPPCDDLTKRRRSSDSALCNRPSSVGVPGPSGATSASGAVDSGCKLRRRSVAGVPDGIGASPGPLTVMPGEPAHRVKTEPEVSTSEPERVPVSEVVCFSGTSAATTTTSAAKATSATAASSVATTPATQQPSPTKRKRGRPFGTKNKAKDSATVGKRRRRKAVATVHPVPAATPTTAVAAAATTKVRTPTTGPYIRVFGTRERPLSSHIVNVAPRTVPEDESKRKKVSAPARVGPHHPTGRRLAGSAAHTSTLSPHYDAVTRDPTWLCAFCLKGSHHQGLGDLYGPYPGTVVRPAEPEPVSCQEEVLRRGRATKRKKSDSTSGTEEGSTPRRCSRQRRPSEAEREVEVSKELWVHETCATWSQGVYLGGNRVHGLQEAVAEAAHLVCCKCKLVGASLGCITRGCSEKYHYLCAVEKGCYLDTENFSIVCSKHKKPNARPS
ncbi:retinoic acid-induced protein 1-like isoform X1 [Dermacentor albipictus]|uniref:retinoic acid-induced protein 1-like isoform X1 n=2 Tax=Dermacentor albipictus TaxID=60249 RepID=UPI0031FD6062